jgi:hypothetical protein
VIQFCNRERCCLSEKKKAQLEAEYLSLFESDDSMERGMANHIKERLEGKKCFRGREEKERQRDEEDGCISCSG